MKTKTQTKNLAYAGGLALALTGCVVGPSFQSAHAGSRGAERADRRHALPVRGRQPLRQAAAGGRRVDGFISREEPSVVYQQVVLKGFQEVALLP